jgi:hypothetical protein
VDNGAAGWEISLAGNGITFRAAEENAGVPQRGKPVAVPRPEEPPATRRTHEV